MVKYSCQDPYGTLWLHLEVHTMQQVISVSLSEMDTVKL